MSITCSFPFQASNFFPVGFLISRVNLVPSNRRRKVWPCAMALTGMGVAQVTADLGSPLSLFKMLHLSEYSCEDWLPHQVNERDGNGVKVSHPTSKLIKSDKRYHPLQTTWIKRWYNYKQKSFPEYQRQGQRVHKKKKDIAMIPHPQELHPMQRCSL